MVSHFLIEEGDAMDILIILSAIATICMFVIEIVKDIKQAQKK